MPEQTATAVARTAAASVVPAVVLAAIITVVAAMLTHLHNGVIIQRNIGLHDYTAPVVMGLFVVVAILNAVIVSSRLRIGMSAAQMALALALTLAATPVHRFIAHGLVGVVGLTPAVAEGRGSMAASLQKANPLQSVPATAVLSPEASRNFQSQIGDPTDVTRFMGLTSPAEVPWREWAAPVAMWSPLILVYIVMSTTMGLLLRRQWAENELVQFPLAQYASMLLTRSPGRTVPDVLSNRSFWVGVVAMVLIFSCHGLLPFFGRMIVPPTKFAYYELAAQFPFLNYSLEGYSLLRGTCFFSVIALAFLIPSELSLTAWVSWPVMVALTYLYYAQTGQRFTSGDASGVVSGAWWAMAALILYGGRGHYIRMIRKSLSRDGSGESWVCRLFLISTVGMIVLLNRLGMPLDVAAVWTLSLLVTLLIICRLVAELGVPWIPVAPAAPAVFLPMLLGESAIGGRGLGVSAMATSILFPQTSSSTMHMAPAVCNAAQVEAGQTTRPRATWLAAPFAIAALVASVFILVWLGYSHDGPANDPPSFESITSSSRTMARLGIDPREAGNVVDRWSAARPAERFIPLFGVGVALVLTVGLLRLRLPRFPLHPLPLVLLGSWLMSRFWLCFLIGWAIKASLLKIGGVGLLEKCRPFFGGVVAGLALTLVTWMFAHVVIYFHEGRTFDASWWRFMGDMYSS